MAKESFVLKSLFGSTSFTRDQRFSHLNEESKTGPFNITLSTSIQTPNSYQGELLRFKKSSKELNIPRWCIIDERSFRYYKSKFSALCEEKPLFELPLGSIVSVSALSSSTEYAIELFTLDESLPYSPISSKFSLKSSSSCGSSRHLMGRPRYLEPRPGKYTVPDVSTVIYPSPDKHIKKNTVGIRESKISWTSRENMMYLTEERLIFIVTSRASWEKWKNAFARFVKVEVNLA